MNFRNIWCVDFEFVAPPGEKPRPICLVAKEIKTGRTLKFWEDEIKKMKKPPYGVDSSSLFVAYYASAENGCHSVLNWKYPDNQIDLFSEFRNLTNGKKLPFGNGLLGATSLCGIDGIETTEKESMRQLVMRGGPWTKEERQKILAYCESDVLALEKLFDKLLPFLDIDQALLRGRFMKAAAKIEHQGVPIDVDSLQILRDQWEKIQSDLIQEIDKDYHVYEGKTFKSERWARWLVAHDISWPHLSSGNLALDDETFRQMARIFPAVAPIRELRSSLSQMRLADLSVGSDNRNRCLLSAFGSVTGRNQPSTSRFIFSPSTWLRSLIKPEPGTGLAYLDWQSQEFGVGAGLSHDKNMMDAYKSRDPYLSFAKQAGAVPSNATKESHPLVRDQFKACVLATQYGMGAQSLASRLNQPMARARELLKLHRETYQMFWRWSDAALDYAMLHNRIWTVFGWTLTIGEKVNPRSIRNFPMQANAAEMLRLACCYLTEAGIKVCAPVHDAVLIEGPLDQLPEIIIRAKELMAQASSDVLGGFELYSDAKIIRYPDRYFDPRGKRMWDAVWGLIQRSQNASEPTATRPLMNQDDAHIWAPV